MNPESGCNTDLALDTAFSKLCWFILYLCVSLKVSLATVVDGKKFGTFYHISIINSHCPFLIILKGRVLYWCHQFDGFHLARSFSRIWIYGKIDARPWAVSIDLVYFRTTRRVNFTVKWIVLTDSYERTGLNTCREDTFMFLIWPKRTNVLRSRDSPCFWSTNGHLPWA